MNKRIFIDCDNTLLLYDEGTSINHYGFFAESSYKVNTPLVEVLKRACRNCFTLIIWSGGGGKYAKTVADFLFSDDLGAVDAWLDKDVSTFSLVRPEDVVIDDQLLAVSCEQLKPDDVERLREILHDDIRVYSDSVSGCDATGRHRWSEPTS